MALVTDPYYGVLTLQLESATTFHLNPTCVPAMPCATPLLDTSGVPPEDYTVAVYEEKSTSLSEDPAGSTSSDYVLVTRTIPYWQYTGHNNDCFRTMTSYLQLETASDYDLTIGFNKGAYAVATSVELDASQGTTVDWIQTMPTHMQSFFVSAYLPQFTEDFSVTVFAAPTESIAATATTADPPAASATPTSYAAELPASSEPLIASRSELRPHQEALAIGGARADGDNKTIIAIVVTLAFLVIFGGCALVVCWVKSSRSRSSETSDSIPTERTEGNESQDVAATMSQTSFRTEPVHFQGNFPTSEGSASRPLNPSTTRFQLGSSVSSESNSSSSSSSSSNGGLAVDLNSLDDPFSDTAVISSLAREPSPAVSPLQSEARHERGEPTD